MKKVLLGMSGGVDSSAAALLLKNQGCDVTGCTLVLFGQDGGALDNVKNAEAVCKKIGIEHITIDLSELFQKKVIDYFISEYMLGRTPNPCIACNINIKFGEMMKYAQSNGFSHIATGHYARIERTEGGDFRLRRAADLKKDQSYVLYHLSNEALSHILFPLGNLTKPEIRSLAEQAGLVTANKPDSQEICFIPDNNHIGFLESRAEKLPPHGSFVDKEGRLLGTHTGIHRYTVGQRKGLGISFGKPMFVCGINAADNTVVLGESGSEYSNEFCIDDIVISGRVDRQKPVSGKIKIRYSAEPQPARVIFDGEKSARVILSSPARAVTPGQAAVLYDGDLVLLGGIIR